MTLTNETKNAILNEEATAEIDVVLMDEAPAFPAAMRDMIEITGVSDTTGPNPNCIYKTVTFQALQGGAAFVNAIAKGRHNSSVYDQCAVTITDPCVSDDESTNTPKI